MEARLSVDGVIGLGRIFVAFVFDYAKNNIYWQRLMDWKWTTLVRLELGGRERCYQC
jgi:hypothetical protein